MTEQHLNEPIHRLASKLSAAAPTVHRADMLDYVADMILELRTLADDADCDLLAALLNLAHREARDRSQAAASAFKP
jgi:hypothetical protein